MELQTYTKIVLVGISFSDCAGLNKDKTYSFYTPYFLLRKAADFIRQLDISRRLCYNRGE
jgi:hypothetical protein